MFNNLSHFSKLMFIIGFIVCNILFFLAGAMTGYLYCEREFAKSVQNKTKVTRVPHKIANAVIGQITDPAIEQLNDAEKKVREPSDKAITQAQKYKNQYID